ncbi:MAG: GNAT family N-acetyltransferase [Smithellaceae bacterium]
MKTSHKEQYPSQYKNRVTLKNGREVLLRPILENDGPLLVDLFNKLSSSARHLRFLGYLADLPEQVLFNFTHVNYDSAFALVAAIEEDGKEAIIAVGRYAYDPDEHCTEFAIAVRDDWNHYGLGKLLLKKTFDVGKAHGISRFVGLIDSQNHVMLQLIKELGYEVKSSPRNGIIKAEIFV